MSAELIVGLIIIAVIVIQFIAIFALIKSRQNSQADVLKRLAEYEYALRDEFARNREEANRAAKDSREELLSSLNRASGQLSATIANFTGLVEAKMKNMHEFLDAGLKYNREELASALEKSRATVEKKLADIQQGNEKKLDEMRHTVDEKLQKTLELRLATSFKTVSENLEQVQKGLGEMKSLASDVGDLKKVMSGSSSKIKGVLGEYQLAAILEQMLAPGQYAKNVKTKPGSDKNVEFAIKIPGKTDANKIVWLPIDSKLPASGYEALLDAYNSGNKKTIEDAQKSFARTVKIFAKDINEKYIDPPNTTDFAIMFLPFEGEYAEVVRDPELFETIQRDYKINVTGPSTICAFLNALQVGFRSLAVEKQTGKIWGILADVKKEFSNFEAVLAKVKEQIDRASSTLETEVGRRTRVINKKLKSTEAIPYDSPSGAAVTESEASPLAAPP